MDLKSIAEAYQSVHEKKLDPVGKEDGDVDNDGDKDSSDSYLMKRRKAIAKAMKKEEVEKDKIEEVQQMDEFVASAMGALNTANKVANVANTVGSVVSAIGNTMKKKKKDDEEDKMEEASVAEHHQKDADGKVIEHEDEAPGTPSSVEEESQETVLAQLAENDREIDAFEAVISYLIDEGFAKSWEEAQDIMTTLKPELVEEVYQNQLWTLFDENYHAMRNPEKYEEKPYKEKSKKERMADPDRGINSPAFKKFMASQGM